MKKVFISLIAIALILSTFKLQTASAEDTSSKFNELSVDAGASLTKPDDTIQPMAIAIDTYAIGWKDFARTVGEVLQHVMTVLALGNALKAWQDKRVGGEKGGCYQVKVNNNIFTHTDIANYVGDGYQNKQVRVKDAQTALLNDKHGFEPGKIDGIWGPQTKIAVKAYQGTYKLGNDGIVGKSTWAMMGTGKNCYR